MRIVSAVLGAGCLLLLLVAGMQFRELGALRAQVVDLQRDLSSCRVEAARPAPAAVRVPPPATPRPRRDDDVDMGLVQQAFEDMAANAPPPRPPPPPRPLPPRQQQDMDRILPPEQPESAEEARQMLADALDQWAGMTDADAADVNFIRDTFDPMFDEMDELHAAVSSGEMEFADANRALAERRRTVVDELRAELGEDGFREMWRAVHPGKMVSLPRSDRP